MCVAVKEKHDVIIIGGGPAGLAAGLYCRRAALDTVLLEKGLLGGQIAISKDVENYPGVRGITGFDLAERMVDHARAFGLSIVQQEVLEVFPGRSCHAVRLADGEVLRSTVIILALGGTARRLNVPGESEYLGRGISYCATCDGPFFRDKNVVVVGGGDTAVEESLYLSRVAKRVSLVHRGGELRASRILEERLRAEPRIEIIGNAIIAEVRGDGDKVTSAILEEVETGERRVMDADGVFVCIGHYPNNLLVPAEIAMNGKGFVITDEKGATNVEGIFAAGDLREKFANQIVIAAADGTTAAIAAAHYIESRAAAPVGKGGRGIAISPEEYCGRPV
jgi:thioredoxin reductase (NADPH)